VNRLRRNGAQKRPARGNRCGSSKTDYPHWRFYLAVMKDLEIVSRYVEPCRENFTTYSLELARILLAVGSEVDVVAKQICIEVAPARKPDCITNYQEILTARYPKLPSVKVSLDRYSLSFLPWETWERRESPAWWHSYNNVKHERHKRFHEGNLKNVLEATAGLCVLVVYLYHGYFEREIVGRPPLFVDTSYRMGGEPLVGRTYKMPDFKKSSAGTSQRQTVPGRGKGTRRPRASGAAPGAI
jgi:hypothetical protein